MAMLRAIAVILLLGCIAAPMRAQTLLAQTPNQQDSMARTPAKQLPAPRQTAVPPSPTQYPLDAFQEFSAIMVGSRAEPGEGRAQGHIYRSGNLIRIEDPGKLGYYITNLTTGDTYGISESGCIHDTHPFIRSFPISFASKPGATLTRASAGKETVDGHSCQIENITVSSPTFANPVKMRFWEAEDLQGFPIKIEFLLNGGHEPIIRYQSIVLGPQDPTLFIHPKVCEPLTH